MANGCNILSDLGKKGESCCNKHDRRYHTGEFWQKFIGDFELLFCMLTSWRKGSNVAETTLYMLTRWVLAVLVFAMVFTVGWVWWLKYLWRRLFAS